MIFIKESIRTNNVAWPVFIDFLDALGHMLSNWQQLKQETAKTF